MPIGIRGVVRGFWQAAKKLGRAYTAASLIIPNDIRRNHQEETRNCQVGVPDCQEGNLNLQEETAKLEAFSASLRKQMGDDGYYQLQPVFTEMPFIRPMGRNTQLPNTIHDIDRNPQRLATKRMKPGYFRVQRGIVIGGRSYDGVGNVALLMAQRYQPVHVGSVWVKMAENGDKETLRNYKNACVMAARQGVVMVSPFISTDEKQVMQVFLQEQLPFVFLTDNGFRDYYKPSDTLFDAVAAGRVLILSPWAYDADKRHISRADCVALNGMAEEICQLFMESDKLKTIMV